MMKIKGTVTTSERKKTEIDKFRRFVTKHLDDKLFASGTELNALLREKFQVTPEYARKIVSRLVESHAIISSKPYSFGRGQFIYLSRGTSLSLEAVKETCRNSRPPIFRLLQALEDNNGVLSYYEAMKITASPKEGSSTKVSTLRDILKLLAKLNLVRETSDENGDVYLFLSDALSEFSDALEDAQRMKSERQNLTEDAILLPDILTWLASVNLFDYKDTKFKNLSKPATGIWHNGLLWDAFSYTRTTGINDFNASKADDTSKKTLVALDVVISKTYTSLQLDGFYNRIQIHLNSVKGMKRKVLPIVIYRNCTPEILGSCRKLGFLAFDIGAVFGNRIYSVLNEVSSLVGGVIPDGDIGETVHSALSAIREAGQEDALGKVKGVLFEVLLYPLMAHLFPMTRMRRGLILMADENGNPKGYEYDYVIHSDHPKEIVVVELKGYKKDKIVPVGDDGTQETLLWFFSRTFPHAKKNMKEEAAKGYPVRGVYMTSGSFDKEGKSLIGQLNAGKTKSAKLDVGYERADLIKLLRDNGFTLEIKIIDTYYL